MLCLRQQAQNSTNYSILQGGQEVGVEVEAEIEEKKFPGRNLDLDPEHEENGRPGQGVELGLLRDIKDHQERGISVTKLGAKRKMFPEKEVGASLW